mmetsp:Transcript_16617/g.51022  ORF Transcript_16617/g.51022 Transcript_16617/m.51022 type:complete len:218 (-) Transcript_16617:384-1037(-)
MPRSPLVFLLGLDEADAAVAVAAVDDVDLAALLAPEDEEVVVHVVEREDGLFQAHLAGQIEGLDLRHRRSDVLEVLFPALLRLGLLEIRGVLIAIQCVLDVGAAVVVLAREPALQLGDGAAEGVSNQVDGLVHIVGLLRAAHDGAAGVHGDLGAAALGRLVVLHHREVAIHRLHVHILGADLGQRRRERRDHVLLDGRGHVEVVRRDLHLRLGVLAL